MRKSNNARAGGPPGTSAAATSSCLADSENSTKTRRFRHLVRRVWKQGPRPVGEILLEFAPDLDVLIQRLERYAEIDPDLVRIADATDWIQPEDLLREVPA